MQTVSSITAARAALAQWRANGDHIALVPTMGNLHRGHMTLVEKARQMADRVVVSIFVNPMQFGANEDFSRYPRTMQDDSLKLGEANVDLLFAPSVDDIYLRSTGTTTRVIVPGISDILCGASRDGHFVGVSTVVAKFFNIIQPHVAIFGEKDFQQLMIIRRMVEDLCMPINIVGVPICRESDGLAMSSRNGYLSPDQRAFAPEIYRGLQRVVEIAKAGAEVDATLKQVEIDLASSGFELDYLALRRSVDLQPATAKDSELVLLVAATLGATRLIDNVTFTRVV